jgi:tetratricopeptide (TPR) repeat protein
MILFFVLVSLSSLQEKVVVAEKLYKEKNYEQAIENYEQVINQGIKNPFVYYNIGNCYFKTGEIGKAILFYKKAKRLLPSDPDINFNLNLARARRVDEIKLSERPKFINSIINFPLRFGLNTLLISCSVCYFLLFTILIITLFFRKKWLKDTNICLFVLLLIFLSLLTANLKMSNIEEGVLLTKVEEVRSGPGEDYSLIFTLHEGAEFRIIGSEGNWFKIVMQNGLTGWLKEDYVGKV